MVVLQTGPVVTIFGLTVLVLSIITVYNAVTVVGAAERCVLTVFGEYRRVLDPGLNIVPPFVSQVHRFEVGDHRLEVAAEALSADGVPTTIRAELTVRVDDVERAFEAVDDHHTALRRACRQRLRERIGETAHAELAAERRALALSVRDDLDRRALDWGVRVEDVAVTAVERTDE